MTLLFILHALAFSLVFFLLSLLGRRLFVTPLRRRIAELELEVEQVRSFSHLWWDCAVDNMNEVDRLKKNLNETAKAHDGLVAKYARAKCEIAHLSDCHKTACNRLQIAQGVSVRLHADLASARDGIQDLSGKLDTMTEYYQNTRNVLDEKFVEIRNLKAELLAKTRKRGERRTAAECLTH